jgi:hypothetical protein
LTNIAAYAQDAHTRATDLLDTLDTAGHSAYVGVPCSLLSPLYDGLAARGGRATRQRGRTWVSESPPDSPSPAACPRY